MPSTSYKIPTTRHTRYCVPRLFFWRLCHFLPIAPFVPSHPSSMPVFLFVAGDLGRKNISKGTRIPSHRNSYPRVNFIMDEIGEILLEERRAGWLSHRRARETTCYVTNTLPFFRGFGTTCNRGNKPRSLTAPRACQTPLAFPPCTYVLRQTILYKNQGPPPTAAPTKVASQRSFSDAL